MATILQVQPVIRWKLRSVMADRKMTATKLADLLSVNRVTVSGWANSDVIPNFSDTNETLNKLCYYLKCSPEELISYTRDEYLED
ncbi:MAG: helix-turn-helix transcriptional regulator [Myxacorys chilensis ATA2-1-KO14]|jgi:putative transcriptional regulator|nr:helix-turn-helix transcriptional regulator [Myxacorys chilensis ATA2-1-KO14]